jgi:hypothetical protein
MPGFRELQSRLLATLRERIRSGELTERGIARRSGLSQPHIHNVLKGEKSLSADAADAVLMSVHLDLLDLYQPGEVLGWLSRH